MLSKSKKPKVILVISYRILDWLYFLVIPLLRKRFKTKFIVLGNDKVKNSYIKILDKRDQFITVDDDLENSFSFGFGLSENEEEVKAREIENYYSINICVI